jgi:hypothetical protein
MRVGRILLIGLVVVGVFAAGYVGRMTILDGEEAVTAIEDTTEPIDPPASAGTSTGERAKNPAQSRTGDAAATDEETGRPKADGEAASRRQASSKTTAADSATADATVADADAPTDSKVQADGSDSSTPNAAAAADASEAEPSRAEPVVSPDIRSVGEGAPTDPAGADGPSKPLTAGPVDGHDRSSPTVDSAQGRETPVADVGSGPAGDRDGAASRRAPSATAQSPGAGEGAAPQDAPSTQTAATGDTPERATTAETAPRGADGDTAETDPGSARDTTPDGGRPEETQTAATTTARSAQTSTRDGGPTERSADDGARDATGDAPSGRPAFDVVRVEPGGAAVIAGRAAPDSSVTVLEDGEPIGRAETNAAGEFVVLPGTRLSAGRSELTLKSTNPSGQTARSTDAVVIATPPGERSPSGGESGEPGAALSGDARGQKPLALKVPRDGSGGAQVLQQPQGRPGPEAGDGGNLAFRVVQYTNRGGLVVSGTASDAWRVRVRLDGRRLGTTRADPGGGKWSIIYRDSIPPGLYTLTAQAVNDGGDVVARTSTPFASQPEVQGLDDARLVVVQPGSNLWTIARRTYGKGVQYTTIYNANQDQIANPDLIYPGQVFVLPEAGAGTAER